MERDVEIQLARELASLQATLSGFAKDTQRRFDAQREALEDIRESVYATNGRVTELEKVNAVREAVRAKASEIAHAAADAVPACAPALITRTDIKWWVAITVGAFGAGAGFAALVGW